MATVVVAWEEPAGQLSAVEGDLPDDAVRQRELVADSDGDPGPAGVYRLLSKEECLVLDMQNPVPVFLHEANEASLVTWLEPLPHAGDEAAVAERVRKAVFDVVEERIANDGVFTPSPVVTSTERVRGSTHVVGRCVVIQPAA